MQQIKNQSAAPKSVNLVHSNEWTYDTNIHKHHNHSKPDHEGDSQESVSTKRESLDGRKCVSVKIPKIS